MSSRRRSDQREPEPVENGDVRRSKRARGRPRYFTEEQEEFDDDSPLPMVSRKYRNDKDSEFQVNSGSEKDSKEKNKKNGRKAANVRKKAKYCADSDSSFKASSSSYSSSGIKYLL